MGIRSTLALLRAAGWLALFSWLGIQPTLLSGQEPPVAAEAAAESPAQSVWQAHIQPLLQTHCQSCHGGAKAEAGLDLRTLESVLSGGDSGPVVVAGDPAASRLWQVLQPDAEMPMPPKGEPLDEDARTLVTGWIERLSSDSAIESWGTGSESYDPLAGLDLPDAERDPTSVINDQLARVWGEQQIVPRDRCDDATFLRRVSLDLTGRLPTPERVEAFLGSEDPERREQYVDELLASREHAEYFAEVFDTLFMGRGNGKQRQGRREHGWIDFLQTAFEENRPWDQVLRDIAIARPEQPQSRGAAWFLFERNNQHQQIAESVGSAMFGVQVQCAQCHDHPLAAEIKQAHYWGLVAFFARGENQMTPQGPRVAESAIGAYDQFTNLSGESFPNRLTFLGVEPLEDPRPAEGEEETDADELYDGPVAWQGSTEGLPRVPKYSRRQAFADEVLAGHPWVARSQVNRVWALLMGRGLVHPVDKIDSVHPASHPELFAWLSRDFETHGYDVRRLVRAIVTSDAYQLAPGRPTPSTDPRSFSYALEKPLTAETLARCLTPVLMGPNEALPNQVTRELIRIFPDVLPEEFVGQLSGSLYLSNNPDFNNLFVSRTGNLLEEVQDLESSLEVAEVMIQRLYLRPPTAQEVAMAASFLDRYGDRREQAQASLLWALVTSAEFRFNH